MRFYHYIFLLAIFLLSSCAKEEIISIKADFSIMVVNDDYSVPVRVEIDNKTTGADIYLWTFEGAVTEESKDKDPKTVYYNTSGTYKIILQASNKDGAQDQSSIEIQIDAAMSVDFEWLMQGSDIAPVTLQMVNKSLGASSYKWEFEGANLMESAEENPRITFLSEGEYTIKLTIMNGRETYSIEKQVTVMPAMTIGFDWTVDFVDLDYQAPVTLHMNNLSINAFSYEWTFVNAPGNIISTEQSPDITIASAGIYTLQLKASNDKESKILQKQITVYEDKNLLSFTNIKLGINTAQTDIGCFFSSVLGKVLTKSDVTDQTGAKVDFAFFGLDNSFSYNQFVSPDKVQQTAFETIPNAINTRIINSQELIGALLTAGGFDAIDEGADFLGLNISETTKGLTPFNNKQNNRIILFQTGDGRKGAIKITSYVSNGRQSYILADIKIQKKP
jgi:PKD repeat protein